MKNNKLIVLTGPSGVGKATIEKELFKDKSLNLSFSISATTRSPRPGEKHGVDYYFISEQQFSKKIAQGAFIEWNQHFSSRYGTLKSEVDKIIASHKIPFLEVETEGAKSILQKFAREDVLSIFIKPPSLKALKSRIRHRGSETPDQIAERLSRVEKEMNEKHHFDYVVVNKKLAKAVAKITKIIKKEIY